MLSASLSWIALAAAGGLTLEAPGVTCPDVAAVRAGLAELGVGPAARAGTASWRVEGERLLLHVEAASAGAGTTGTATVAPAVTERVLPLGPCRELADAVALAIERATAPLGVPVPVEPPTPMAAAASDGMAATATVATSTAAQRGRTWGLAVHVGPTLLVGAAVEPGLAAGLSVWPVRVELDAAAGSSLGVGGVLALGVALPSTFEAGAASLRLQRFHAELGPALRWRSRAGLELGVGALALLDHLRGEPSGLQTSTAVRDVRVGGVLAPWVGWSVGALGLRLGAELRVLGGARSYRAVPATELVTLPVIEGLAWLSAGYVREETR